MLILIHLMRYYYFIFFINIKAKKYLNTINFVYKYYLYYYSSYYIFIIILVFYL